METVLSSDGLWSLNKVCPIENFRSSLANEYLIQPNKKNYFSRFKFFQHRELRKDLIKTDHSTIQVKHRVAVNVQDYSLLMNEVQKIMQLKVIHNYEQKLTKSSVKLEILSPKRSKKQLRYIN